ncbi:MAG: OmpH family outer membrane protein [Deltaproteobacteria bacterium]|nr:OmpH family outer membrane protein [Deltaproteobacteria bacterium]
MRSERRSRRQWALGLGLVLVLAAQGAAAAQGGKIGVVDLQRCLTETKQGQKYRAEFTARAEQTRADLDKKEAALKELRETLEKQGLVLSPAARQDKEKEYREKLDAFKELYKASQQALQKQDQELTGRILKDLRTVIQEIGDAGGYALVVERQEGGVLYAVRDADLTDEVIRRFDQKVKAE